MTRSKPCYRPAMELHLPYHRIGLALAVVVPLHCHADAVVDSVAADNREIASAILPHSPQPPLRIASSARSVAIRFREENPSSLKPLRLRYKLEGVDPEWRDPECEMAVWLRLLDKHGTIVSGDSMSLHGETPGWTGRPDDSPLVSRTIRYVVPGDAAGLWIFFISNGGRETLGQMVAGDVTVSIQRAGASTNEIISLDCLAGNRNPAPLELPRKWSREGERPDIAQLLARPGVQDNLVLFLNDQDPDKFGVWRSRPMETPLKAGDRVTLQWKTAYSIGKGGQGTATYSALKPGNYWFRIITTCPNGLPVGGEISLPVVIMPPAYQRPTFWFAALAALCGFAILVTRRVTKNRMQARLVALERQRMLEGERTRIARDIHDDLGATLSQVAMLSEMARTEAGDPQVLGELLGDIFTRAQSATRSLDEIVWAIKPENDRPESLVRYLSQFADTHLSMAGLRFRLDAPDSLPTYTLTSAQRHNLFLAAKEALHNIVKHAHATEVWMRITVRDNTLSVVIEDNGTGQVPSPDTPPSRGSANMHNRMTQIGGHYSRTGTPGRGTLVEFTLPMEHLPYDKA